MCVCVCDRETEGPRDTETSHRVIRTEGEEKVSI